MGADCVTDPTVCTMTVEPVMTPSDRSPTLSRICTRPPAFAEVKESMTFAASSTIEFPTPLAVSFVAVITSVCVTAAFPVEVMVTGPPVILPRVRPASESFTEMEPTAGPLTLVAENAPILLPAWSSVMSLPPVLVTDRSSAITASVWDARPLTVTDTDLPLIPASVRSSSSFSVIVEPGAVAVADTVDAAIWTLMFPVPAVSTTADPATSGVGSPGVTSRIERPATSVTVLAVAAS